VDEISWLGPGLAGCWSLFQALLLLLFAVVGRVRYLLVGELVQGVPEAARVNNRDSSPGWKGSVGCGNDQPLIRHSCPLKNSGDAL
jgi:hypothetical protein